jgi:hypothetical protein
VVIEVLLIFKFFAHFNLSILSLISDS